MQPLGDAAGRGETGPGNLLQQMGLIWLLLSHRSRRSGGFLNAVGEGIGYGPSLAWLPASAEKRRRVSSDQPGITSATVPPASSRTDRGTESSSEA